MKAIDSKYKAKKELFLTARFLDSLTEALRYKKYLDKEISRLTKSASKVSTPTPKTYTEAKEEVAYTLLKSLRRESTKLIKVETPKIPDKFIDKDVLKNTEKYIKKINKSIFEDWKELLSKEDDNYNLFLIIENDNTPKIVKDGAFEKILTHPEKDIMELIIVYCGEEYGKKAKEALKDLIYR